MTNTNVVNSRQDLAQLYHSLSREDAVWSVKYLTDYLYSLVSIVQEEQSVPSWWNRPLSEKTKAMQLSPAHKFGDYKVELESILAEKYA